MEKKKLFKHCFWCVCFLEFEKSVSIDKDIMALKPLHQCMSLHQGISVTSEVILMSSTKKILAQRILRFVLIFFSIILLKKWAILL